MIKIKNYQFTAGIDWGTGRIAPTGFYKEIGKIIYFKNKQLFQIRLKKFGIKPKIGWNKQ